MDLIDKHSKIVQFEGQDILLPLFLDHQSTTPLAPEVREKMLEVMATPGNSESSSHAFGIHAQEIILEAQREVANLINAHPDEIIFTSGATEANNLAIFGSMGDGSPEDKLITTKIEHSSILAPALALERNGCQISRLPLGSDGRLDISTLESKISTGTSLVSIQTANNEIGTLQNISQIGKICEKSGVAFHTDAAQALNSQVIDVKRDSVTFLSLSGHKIYGPQGIGALFVKRGTKLAALIVGGDQQNGIRSGTLPTALIAGLGAACKLTRQNRAEFDQHLQKTSNLLKQELRDKLGANIQFNGALNAQILGCISVTFKDIDAEDFLLEMPEIALSTGSACASQNIGPSHVLSAIGLDPTTVSQTVRIGLGRYVTETEARFAANLLAKTYLDLVI
ncbi:hypothetical protein A9Q83_07100 [Alphaproteobacteria bacterium 46_93_T64]|nr:hypothetical protein A9Q83_07100 [Alphaproteobacteria bacterium 46_93_T64]